MVKAGQSVVQHNYVDHADDPAPAIDHYENLARRGTLTVFPLKLYNMLQRVEEDGHADIVSWQPHGRCFVVHKPQDFKSILPKYFQLNKVSSFQRQINLYGFKRLCQLGPDKGGYYHPYFLRGKAFLIQKLDRVSIKGTGVRRSANPDGEPNFLAMKSVGTTPSPARMMTPVEVSDNDKVEELELSGLDPLPIDTRLSPCILLAALNTIDWEMSQTTYVSTLSPHGRVRKVSMCSTDRLAASNPREDFSSSSSVVVVEKTSLTTARKPQAALLPKVFPF